jgi:hypothetical protein
MKIVLWAKTVLLFGAFVTCLFNGYGQHEVKFSRNVLTKDFYAEGVAVADVNNDGKTDVLAGTEWYEAPTWKKHDITKPATYKTTDYSQSFLQYAMDVDQDGWTDLIRIGYPGEPASWYQNPGKKKGYWKEHSVYTSVGNESPSFYDIDGDGRKDLVCNNSELKKVIWISAPAIKNDTTWTEHLISSDTLRGTHKYTHGLGFGDMNLDGRIDVIYREGWWEAPADRKQPDWNFHPADLGKECAQMYVMDLDEDGDQDVISSSAHNYGIWWHEQIKSGDSIAWKHHDIFTEFSQSHGLRLADINGDGHPDLITGKRYYAHNGGDPGAEEPAVIYWFEYKPGKVPLWTPHLIDNDSGAGLNFVVEDMNKDKRPDIVVSNKKGVFVFVQDGR